MQAITTMSFPKCHSLVIVRLSYPVRCKTIINRWKTTVPLMDHARKYKIMPFTLRTTLLFNTIVNFNFYKVPWRKNGIKYSLRFQTEDTWTSPKGVVYIFEVLGALFFYSAWNLIWKKKCKILMLNLFVFTPLWETLYFLRFITTHFSRFVVRIKYSW